MAAPQGMEDRKLLFIASNGETGSNARNQQVSGAKIASTFLTDGTVQERTNLLVP